MNIPPPPLRDPFTQVSWIMWFQAVYQALRLPIAGPSTGRPTVGVPTGHTYYDETLGKPIWYDGSVWRDATGVVA